MVSGNPGLSALRYEDIDKWRAKVLTGIKTTTSLSAAARKLGVTKRTLSRWLMEDPKLSKAMKTGRKS